MPYSTGKEEPLRFPHLFSPIRFGPVEIPNRMAAAPLGVGLLNADETWHARSIRYYEERAMGGIGLIITGFTRVHGSLAGIPLVGIYDDRFIPSHKVLTDRVHRYDSKIFLQIALGGGAFVPEAPSAVYCSWYPAKPRALTTGEIDSCLEAFIAAAGRAAEAGYDGVEVHGAHSYFIGQMMSPALNRRTDKYGGSFEGRMKFPSDVITGIKEKHPDLPVGFKFSAYEAFEGGIDIDLAKDIARHIAGLGIAYLHVSTTALTFEEMNRYSAVPVLYLPRNSLVPLAEEIKKAVPDAVVMGTGSITVPEEAEEILASGKCEMVALGRTLLADPHWPNHARAGKHVVSCIRCNVCYRQLWAGEALLCSVNPYLGREAEQDLPIPSKKKKVMVVGAGPAGMRCALTAGKRGHDVTLYDKQPYLGGMVYPGSRPAFKEDVGLFLEWFEEQIGESKVKVRLKVEVTPDMVRREAPDALVIAVGAEPNTPGVPGIDDPKVAPAVEVLRDVKRYRGVHAVVVGGGDVGCETACHLADNGWKVTIVEMLPRLMEGEGVIDVKPPMFAMLEERDITIMTSTKFHAVTAEGVEVVRPNGRIWGVDADLVALATGFKQTPKSAAGIRIMNLAAIRGPVGEMAAAVEEAHLIGDCAHLGRIREAVEDGERIGRWL
jgi:2,4-dienoyl-CoA reductase-like NADH-dependent reductase (Old Yellow Enzyme family)/NADPH-dependent 2,4-dienoyl-CoA reductase/sulfur reductase-like enzyme